MSFSKLSVAFSLALISVYITNCKKNKLTKSYQTVSYFFYSSINLYSYLIQKTLLHEVLKALT